LVSLHAPAPPLVLPLPVPPLAVVAAPPAVQEQRVVLPAPLVEEQRVGLHEIVQEQRVVLPTLAARCQSNADRSIGSAPNSCSSPIPLPPTARSSATTTHRQPHPPHGCTFYLTYRSRCPNTPFVPTSHHSQNACP
jgi:hypothetical protein